MEKLFQELLKSLKISNAEFQIKNSNFYKRLSSGENLSLMIGEAYMEKEWESDNLANVFRKIIISDNYYTKFIIPMFKQFPLETSKLIFNGIKIDVEEQIRHNLLNNQSIELSKRVGEQHYDIPDILYEYMLDSQRQYTCGYWKPNTKTLEEAQQNKIKLLIDKLQIPEDSEMYILDIGCGWGGLTNAISKRYPKCKIEGISISKEQIDYANEKYAQKNKNLRYYFCDYRDLPNKKQKYDRIISVGMFEHVGVKNYNTFFNVCENILTKTGIFILHTISQPRVSTYLTGQQKYIGDKWFDTYIFPGGILPTAEQVLSSAQSQNLMYHHIQNLSISYAKTLKEWYKNFTSNWKVIRKSNPKFFTKKFYRMWEFYLIAAMVNFEKKQFQLTQFVFTKTNYNGMYIFTEK